MYKMEIRTEDYCGNVLDYEDNVEKFASYHDAYCYLMKIATEANKHVGLDVACTCDVGLRESDKSLHLCIVTNDGVTTDYIATAIGDIAEVIKGINEWASANWISEKELRKAVRNILPSWKVTRGTEYGLYNRNGCQKCRFEVYKGDERYSVCFWQYDSYWDANESYNIYTR